MRAPPGCRMRASKDATSACASRARFPKGAKRASGLSRPTRIRRATAGTEALVFDRPLGIKRNAVILPPGYQLVSCNVPSQVLEEAEAAYRYQLHEPDAIPGSARDSSETTRPRRDRGDACSPRCRTRRPSCGGGRVSGGRASDGTRPRVRARVQDRGVSTSSRSHRRTRSACITTTWNAQRHRPMREHRAARKHRVESVRQNPGYGRSAQGRDTQR